MNYTVAYTKQAETELLGFPAKIQRQLARKIGRLQHGFTGDIKKLQAADNVYPCVRAIFGFCLKSKVRRL